MRFNRLDSRVFLSSVVLAIVPATMPRWAVASATPPPAVAGAADQEKKDADKKDSDKKEDEPKGEPVDVDKLPKAVVDAVKKEMPGARITKAAKLEDGNYFLDDVKVGKKLWDVTVSPKGKIIRKVEMKD